MSCLPLNGPLPATAGRCIFGFFEQFLHCHGASPAGQEQGAKLEPLGLSPLCAALQQLGKLQKLLLLLLLLLVVVVVRRPKQLAERSRHVNIMKEGKVKKARRKDSPKPAEPQSGVRHTAKLLPGAEALAKPLPRKRTAPTSTRLHSLLKPTKALQPHLRGVLRLPRPAPNLL